jgi:hypothetical protein
MTTDVDRVSEISWHLFALIGEAQETIRRVLEDAQAYRRLTDSPVEVIIGTIFLYNLLGIHLVIFTSTSLINVTRLCRCFQFLWSGSHMFFFALESLRQQTRGCCSGQSHESP